MTTRSLERFKEKGAVAVMVAIMATLLFTLAAMSVDLGNAWARKRAVQKQVDVSAISAGWKLPMDTTGAHGHTPTEIATEVATYLNNAQNHVAGQATVVAGDLLDGVTANGEITWLTSDPDHPNQNVLIACTDNCDAMRVLAPTARVGFGFASVIGISGANVQRTATVQVRSELPPRTRTLPFWLPSGCGYGPTDADTTQGGGPQATATASPTATATTTAPVTPNPVDSDIVLTGAAVTSVGYGGTTSVSNFGVTGVNNSYKKVTLRAFAPGGATYVDFGGELTGDGTFPQFQVGTEISDTPGNWTVYALAQKNGAQAQPSYSSTNLTIQVTGGPTASPTATDSPTATAAPGGCIGQDRGNFGQLQSPRSGVTDQQALGYNIAQGLDHTLRPYVFPTGVSEVKVCDANGDPPGAQLDDQAGTAGNGANCVQNDTGNDGPKMYDGFFTGPAAGIPGRLDTTAPGGATTCAGRGALFEGGVSVNNDTLACFLRNGATPGMIAQTAGVTTSMLDPAIVKSPRFVWLPTVYATDRAQHGFQPIKQFVPGFITEETQTSGPNDSSNHVNGFDLNGNSVKVLHVFTFNSDALPPNERGDTIDYDPDVGESVVKLVR